MPLGPNTVKVKGLTELRKELRKLDNKGLTDELKQANYDVAQLVVTAARATASTPMEHKAAGSLTAGRQAARAVVSGGGAKAPFFGGAEFGAGQNILRTGPSGRQWLGYNQFMPWRGSGENAGYFLWPAIRSETDRIVDLYGDEIERIAAKAFPD